jgi:TRAP-type mannitol/chloroaromatic compound transport system substrate-binding protein
MAGGEIFAALQSGAIDATEWVGPWNDLAFGFYKVTKYYYYPGIHEPGTALSFAVNKKLWDGLNSEHKAIIQSAAAAQNDETLAEFNARNGGALAKLVGEHNVKLRKFSDDVMASIGGAAGQVVAEVAAGDPMTKKVYESFIKFRKEAIGWTALSETAFTSARSLKYKYG